jgi:hypothetical protein
MSLFLVLAAARIVAYGVIAPAYFWQDAAVALAWLAVKRRAVFWVLALYVAINVPVMRALGTPLTWPMLRAAGGPLADSMRHYLTWQNALAVVVVLAVATLGDRMKRRSPLLAEAGILFAILVAGLMWPVDTAGRARNAWTALIPRTPLTAAGDWRTTGFEPAPPVDLARFQRLAAGKNILFVSLESTAAQYLGLYGASPDPMPNLSELARSAIVFDNAYAVYPESIKGLLSILCSQYPPFDTAVEDYAAAPCRSAAAMLAGAGYRTALFHSGRFGYLGMEAVIRNRGFGVLEDAGDIGGNHRSSFGVDEPATVARILAWIDGLRAGERFFVAYLPIAGHHPYATPEPGPFPEPYEIGRYRNALHYGDESLGALMRGLRERGLDRSTVWVVLGDHGEAFGQHPGNYGHTFHLYEENVHVPFLIAAPGAVAGQVRRSQVVSLIDTAPTLLDLAGIPAPSSYQGRSMLVAEPQMALFFADYSLGLLGLRDGPRKFIYEMESGRGRMFDLARDPGEARDISESFRERANWYARDLRNWSAAQRIASTLAGRRAPD